MLNFSKFHLFTLFFIKMASGCWLTDVEVEKDRVPRLMSCPLDPHPYLQRGWASWISVLVPAVVLCPICSLGYTVISYLTLVQNELLAVVFASLPQASLFLWYSQNLCEVLGNSGSPGSKHGIPWSLSQVPVSAGLLLSFPLHDFFISLQSGLRWGARCGSMKKGSWSDLFVSSVCHSSHHHSA